MLFSCTYMATVDVRGFEQESPAVADKPARRESMPKIAPIRCENKLQTT